MSARLIYRWGSLFRGHGGKHSQSWELAAPYAWMRPVASWDGAWTRMLEGKGTPPFAEELWASNFSALSHSWSVPSLSPHTAWIQTLQLPHPNDQITRRSVPSTLGTSCVTGLTYFCLWSSVPSFYNPDNDTCQGHMYRTGRMFIMCQVKKKSKKLQYNPTFVLRKRWLNKKPSMDHIIQNFEETVYKHTGEMPRGQTSN